MAERRVQSTVRAGDVVYVGPAASPQFSAGNGFRFRAIRTHHWTTSWEGWAWLDGYQLNAAGDAVERRSIYVDLMRLPPAALPPKLQR
ncbi:hypothetical protein [Dactylosporangium matsuzakiense]|uniref:hypothetical protein n=1 Tax=Dactylosporangium matsuzakiense TaxID=53360 RepID=UPI0022F2BDF4|nr:hypothetical protein [Dactylosporangium matsuzakiense]